MLSDGACLIDRFDGSLMGLDPDDILVAPSPLTATKGPTTVTIGRCDCGILGCGSVTVQVQRDGDAVRWTGIRGRPVIEFDAQQYHAEVPRAVGDVSWEPPDRTAGRLIAERVDRHVLCRYLTICATRAIVGL